MQIFRLCYTKLFNSEITRELRSFVKFELLAVSMSTIRYKYILQYFSVYEKGPYQLEISNEVRGREGGKKKDGIGLGKKKQVIWKNWIKVIRIFPLSQYQ